MYRRQNYTVHFWSFVRGVTIIINYENMLCYTADDNALFVKLRKKNQLKKPFRHSYRPESAGNVVLRLSDLKIFWVGHALKST